MVKREMRAVAIMLLVVVTPLAMPAAAAQGPVPETEGGLPPPRAAGPLGPPKPHSGSGLLYLTSLDPDDSTFAVYDPAADAWTNLTPFETGCQMAVDGEGQLWAYDFYAHAIDVYDPGTDSWSYVVDAPPSGYDGTYCNLEMTQDGVLLYTEPQSDKLWYLSGGTWNELALPFFPNATGDYDPLTEAYVVGEKWTTNAHLINVHTWAITDYASSIPNGEWARFGVVLDGKYFFEVGGSPIQYFDLGNPALPPYDTGMVLGWYGSAAADRANHIIYVASLDGTQLWAYDPATNSAAPRAGGPAAWTSSLAFAGAPEAQPTMHVGNIEGYFVEDPSGRPKLLAQVLAVDEGGLPLGGVLVDGSIWYPAGGPVLRGRYTRPTGWARFHWGSPYSGDWSLCVDNLTLAGYLYEPADNVVTCAEWSQP